MAVAAALHRPLPLGWTAGGGRGARSGREGHQQRPVSGQRLFSPGKLTWESGPFYARVLEIEMIVLFTT